jgi:glycosyltransferase involved in cell wall biosynthesis
MPSPLLTVIVPVFNEERTLTTIMHAIVHACPHAQIVYVDDGSSDGSLAILRSQCRPHDVVLTKSNGGKGSAVLMGLKEAKGEYSVIQDADLEYDPQEIPLLLQRAQKETGCAVFGSRFLRPNPNLYKRYLWGNKVLTACVNLLFRSHLTDSYTCYKLLPTQIFRSLDLHARGFEFEAELCAQTVCAGVPIHEIPISYHPRRIADGKKINWKDAIRGLATLFRIRCERKTLAKTGSTPT